MVFKRCRDSAAKLQKCQRAAAEANQNAWFAKNSSDCQQEQTAFATCANTKMPAAITDLTKVPPIISLVFLFINSFNPAWCRLHN